jgi:hypothetical protein
MTDSTAGDRRHAADPVSRVGPHRDDTLEP